MRVEPALVRERRPGGAAVSAVFLLGLALLAGCGDSTSGATPQSVAGAGGDPPAEDAIAVRVEEVRLEAVSSLYATSATLRADAQATVTARTRGVVRGLLVEEGDRVDGGVPLAVLEDDEQKIEFERASTTRDTKLREFDRAESLHGQGLISEEEYERIRREAEESRHSAELARLMLGRTVITAPFSGKILRRHLDVGATVVDGTAVYDLADLDPLYADVSVPEREVARLAPNQVVRLIAGASGGATRASIERIAPLVDSETGTVKVTLSVDEATGLRPGSFVRVEIVTETHAEAVVVPRAALVAEGRRWHLFRVTAEHTVERLEVTRGFEEADRVEIVGTPEASEALRPGDQVVVVGASALTDGARIQVLEAPAATEESSRGPAGASEESGVST